MYVDGTLKVCDKGLIEVSKISSCCCDPINFLSPVTFSGDVTICDTNLIVSNIVPCDTKGITINGDVAITGALSVSSITSNSGILSLCNLNVQVSQLSGCNGSSVVINNLKACTATLGDISSCAGTINFVDSNVNVDGSVTATEVRACLGVTTNLLSACSNDEIIVESTLSLEDNLIVLGSTVDFCASNLHVSNVFPCAGTAGINFNGPIIVTGISSLSGTIDITSNIEMCGHSLSTSVINGCANALTINGNITSDSITSSGTITACLGIVTNTLSSCAATLNIADNTIVNGSLTTTGGLVTTTISSQTGTVDITSNLDVTGLLTACNLTTGTITPCGNTVNVQGSLTATSIGSNSSLPLIVSSDLQLCGNNLVVSDIISCDGTTPISILPGITTNSISSLNYDLVNTSVGGGVSILGTLVGPSGNVRSFKSLTSSTITITSTPTTVNLDINMLTTGSNLGTGAEVYSNTVGNVLFFRTLVNTDGNLVITQGVDEVSIDLGNDVVTSGLNVGTGTGTVYSGVNNNQLLFRNLNSTVQTLTINNNGNNVDFNQSFSNNVASGTLTAPASIPPLTWTSFTSPTITANPGFSVNAGGIQSNDTSFRIIFDIPINMNVNAQNLNSIGATYVIFRFVNAGVIKDNKSQPVIPNSSINDLFTGNYNVQYEFYDQNQANNATLQVWHNGNVNWTGANNVSYIINYA
ncbi:MAG TPA: hypothetical protein VHA52_01095 [Candidatus Babeliaceae bacterium]|nr:hypothetical protein [Candidatus Babeliaceae bacterium]